jgi:alkanesulfonate monooxygenase SsuD/methylene tetrahydromethanopterin reductase-like flavin-dependent oxidoreductase (luciferase family)
LRECVEVVDALLRGEIVEHVGQFETHGALSWTPGPLPIAIAGRGPRVERFAAERADWILLAGRPVNDVAGLVQRLRALGLEARGRPPMIAWNPNIAWTPALQADVRQHLAYMVVDMPPAERAALGPDALLERYAVSGDRAHVIARLAALREQVQPELFVFDANDYSVSFLEDLAAVASAAGIVRSA